jgi:protein-S-isoprenylcysteine O-methyltransferase Ste14
VRPADLFYKVATGSERRRALLTPVGLAVFFGLLFLIVFGSLQTDAALNLPGLLPGTAGLAIAAPLLAAGLVLWAWCVVWFRRAKGTPVPFNPPRELVAVGPYAWVRNPMLTGVFACLFGLGFLLHSVSMVFLWTPVFVVANVIELKLIEEPELERRFGESYREYRRRVPMFVPRKPGVGRTGASSTPTEPSR